MGYNIDLYFGLPGCGKSTLMAAIALRAVRSGRRVYSNMPLNIPGVYSFDADWLGKYLIENALVLLDEGTILFDSRDFKNFGRQKTDYFMRYRHYRCDIKIFVQRWDAVDLKIRSVTSRVYYVYRGLFLGHWFSSYVRVPYKLVWATDSNGKPTAGDILMGYKRPAFGTRVFAHRVYRPKYYRYFDSYSHPDLPLPPTYEYCPS